MDHSLSVDTAVGICICCFSGTGKIRMCMCTYVNCILRKTEIIYTFTQFKLTSLAPLPLVSFTRRQIHFKIE